MSSDGNLNPPLAKKIAWGVIQSTAAAVLLLSGGLEALQRMAIIAALPFTLVMVLMVRGLLKAMRYEVRHEWTERRKRRTSDRTG
jgi:glycine betaine transporter